MDQNQIDDIEIAKEAQLRLLQGEYKLRCKSVISEMDDYELKVDKFLNSGDLDNKQIIKITSFQTTNNYKEILVINQIWYYD